MLVLVPIIAFIVLAVFLNRRLDDPCTFAKDLTNAQIKVAGRIREAFPTYSEMYILRRVVRSRIGYGERETDMILQSAIKTAEERDEELCVAHIAYWMAFREFSSRPGENPTNTLIFHIDHLWQGVLSVFSKEEIEQYRLKPSTPGTE